MHTCFWCGEQIHNPNKGQKDRFRVTGRMYCSKKCSAAYCRIISSKTMTQTNKKYASKRMKEHNPMHNLEIKEKMVATLKTIKHKPLKRGGNGMVMPIPQKMFFDRLKEEHECFVEYTIPTKIRKGNGYPTCYKIDIAIPSKMIAIEIDGRSHCALITQARDKKKESFLTDHGWSVYRFKNKQIIDHLETCVNQVLG